MKTLRSYGDIQEILSPSGNRLEILPMCYVPIETLMEEHWGIVNPYGYTRSVRSVETLKTSEFPGLFIKSPERVFTTKTSILSQNIFWWGKSKSGEIPIRIDHHLVEEQIEWEAMFLLELALHDIPAERPLAIVTYPSGHKELIVQKIERGYGVSKRNGLNREELKKAIVSLGFIPEDYGDHNVVIDPSGTWHIIDVNRWSWPPHTDTFHQKLLELIRGQKQH